jgi:hypothetical protein
VAQLAKLCVLTSHCDSEPHLAEWSHGHNKTMPDMWKEETAYRVQQMPRKTRRLSGPMSRVPEFRGSRAVQVQF